MKTTIEWATDVWNPVTGCTKVSQGCKHCYAEGIAKRFWGERKFSDVQIHEDRLQDPYHWRKPRRVFVNSMSDLFHPAVPDEFIWRVFQSMVNGNRRHTYMILTKRPERMKAWFDTYQERFWHYHAPDQPQREYVAAPWPDPCIWLGVSVENQQAADERIPHLLATPAAVRFISAEPLLGEVRLKQDWLICPGGSEYGHGMNLTTVHAGCCKQHAKLNWVICGGESGQQARPMHPDWARGLRDQCQAVAVPFFFKQWGEWSFVTDQHEPGHALYERVGKKKAGRLLDGQEWNQLPEVKP